VFVPEQPDQIATDVRRAVDTAVRDAVPGIVVSVSTSGRVHKDFRQRAEVLDLDGIAKPDLASLTLGSMNFATQPSVNSPDTIRGLAEAMRERGIVPELEIFDFGMKSKISHYLIGRGVLHPPFVCNLMLGSLGTSAATAHNLWVWVHHSGAPECDRVAAGDAECGCRHRRGRIVASNTVVGPHVLLNRGANVGHDNWLGEFVTIAPGATLAGGIVVGAGAYIGVGAVVRDHVTIGAGAVVAAGAVVVKPVEPNVLVAGCPATVMRRGVDGL